jgi:hypothetical protein
MDRIMRSAALRLAKATESRRSFLGKGARWTFAAVAALAANASFDVISASACGCNPPCGQYCGQYVSGSCNNSSTGCSGSCYQNLWYWNPNNCWFDGCNRTCCDCWCPGSGPNAGCNNNGWFQCGCVIVGTRPQGTMVTASKLAVEARWHAMGKPQP